jgi:DNA repair protein RecO (recombination protein O)
MYRKYHTKGFVLKSIDLGESSKSFFIFTEVLGLVRASARSVRDLKSKLRYGLSDYAFSDLTIINTKNGWKITGASDIFNFYSAIEGRRSKIICANIFVLLKKLLPENESQPVIFKTLVKSFHFLTDHEPTTIQLKSLEYLMVLRILKSLGYLDSQNFWFGFIESEEFNVSILDDFSNFQGKAVLAINRSLRESQLI